MANETATTHNLLSQTLLEFGLTVIEHRARREDKSLSDWQMTASFRHPCDADQYFRQYCSNGYFKVIYPPE